MCKRLIAIGIAFFSIYILSPLGAAQALSLGNVQSTMDKMLVYHVENKTFSPLIVRRSFKVYLEQFDPEHIYLLKEEAEPFLTLKDQEVEEVIKDYYSNRFSYYSRLNEVIEKAIIRSRLIRKKVQEEFKQGNSKLSDSTAYFSLNEYPDSEEELKEKIATQLINYVNTRVQSKGLSNPSFSVIEKILNYHEKKERGFEKKYMEESPSLKESFLTFHILKAFAKSLDAHTGYYSPEEAFEMRVSLKKQFAGVGVVLRQDFDGVFISGLVEGSVASRSGQIQVGDVLVTVNHQGTEHIIFEELVRLVQGREGERVTLGVKRSIESSDIVHVDLIREKIIMNDERLQVQLDPYEGGVIGKITLSAFYDNGDKVSAERDLKEALRNLRDTGNLIGVVLDMRENSGGFLTQAIKVSSLFIPSGLIVITKYANEELSYSQDVNGRQSYNGPLVILTSKASASAAEVVAQALQDYGVALVVGDKRSFGKGTMQYQTLTDEKAEAFFKVTVGRYYTASGRSPQIEGVKADIVIPTQFFPYKIGERYLQFPIDNDHLSTEIFQSLKKVRKGSVKEIKKWMVPYLKPRQSRWRQMLPQLVENSYERLRKSKNFQLFLKIAKGGGLQRSDFPSERAYKEANSGLQDLQMQEAVDIVKDMALLNRLNETSLN